MGHVFLSMSAGGRPIAVKVIREELADDPQFRTRFRDEVAAARKVGGLFTAFVVDAELDGPMPWLATAYVAGPSLLEAVREHGPLPTRTLLALAAGLAESLSAIHAAGVVHRDLKPSNVLLAEDGPRVIDFGISGAAEASAQTGANVMIGSPGFMSPEQVLGHGIGPSSDMFSLGAVLAFAGTGLGPFGSGSNAALVYRVVNSPADLAALPEEVRRLVGGCLAKHPNDRPTARELLAQVGAIAPAPGWLSEAIIYGSAGDQAAAGLSGSAAGSGPPAARRAPDEPEKGRAARPAHRRRLSRPLVSACLTAGLVGASAAVVFALTGAGPARPLTPQAQAQAGGVQTTPSAASHGSVAPRPLSSSRPAVPAPNAYLTPSLSEFLTTSPPATVLPTRSPAPGKSAAPGKSPAPSKSPAPGKSATPSASPSPSGSASPSPSPSPTDTGSASPSPSPSQSASPSPSDTDVVSPAPSDSTTPSPASS